MSPSLRIALQISLVLTVTARAAVPLECRWADTPPVRDGRADEAVWERAQRVENFGQPWDEGAPVAKARTAARLLWDREWIYFFAEMQDSDVVAEVREHDGPMWENDVFEVFLRPSLAHAGYFEFEVNPVAAVLDAFFPGVESWRRRVDCVVGGRAADAGLRVVRVPGPVCVGQSALDPASILRPPDPGGSHDPRVGRGGRCRAHR